MNVLFCDSSADSDAHYRKKTLTSHKIAYVNKNCGRIQHPNNHVKQMLQSIFLRQFICLCPILRLENDPKLYGSAIRFSGRYNSNSDTKDLMLSCTVFKVSELSLEPYRTRISRGCCLY